MSGGGGAVVDALHAPSPPPATPTQKPAQKSFVLSEGGDLPLGFHKLIFFSVVTDFVVRMEKEAHFLDTRVQGVKKKCHLFYVGNCFPSLNICTWGWLPQQQQSGWNLAFLALPPTGCFSAWDHLVPFVCGGNMTSRCWCLSVDYITNE